MLLRSDNPKKEGVAVKKDLIRLGIGAALFGGAIAASLALGWGLHGDMPWVSWESFFRMLLFLPAYFVIGGEVLWNAIRNIGSGQIFDENFLMAIATVGAFVLGECMEGVAVMLFFQIGELFEHIATNRSRESITELMNIRPDYANVKRNGAVEKVDPNSVAVGETIVIRPGEKVPLDGVVLSGSSLVDTKALTGESVPREVREGEEILSGCINESGLLEARVTKAFGESTVSKILDLVENAVSRKSKAESFITKFARVYTPIVCIAAVLVAVLPPLIFGIGNGELWMMWIRTALSFLVVSCPCALVISVPLSFFGGIGSASKQGVLVKGSSYLEALAKTEVVVFDKTGTLTKGTFNVTEIHPCGMTEAELLELTAHAESSSTHPISQSLLKAYEKPIDAARITAIEEIAGHGVKAVVDGKTVLAGNHRLMDKFDIIYESGDRAGTVVHVAVDGQYGGYIVIADEIKPDAKAAMTELKSAGVQKTVMLTGDNNTVAQEVAKVLGVDEVHSQLLPGDKVTEVEKLMEQKSSKGKLAFVGDGINDAPVLARADIGVAMGGLGSDAAIEAADVVIMTDEPSKLGVLMRISKKTRAIVMQNIVFAIGVKTAVQILSVTHLADSIILWLAVFADVGVSILAILNAVRMIGYKDKK